MWALLAYLISRHWPTWPLLPETHSQHRVKWRVTVLSRQGRKFHFLVHEICKKMSPPKLQIWGRGWYLISLTNILKVVMENFQCIWHYFTLTHVGFSPLQTHPFFFFFFFIGIRTLQFNQCLLQNDIQCSYVFCRPPPPPVDTHRSDNTNISSAEPNLKIFIHIDFGSGVCDGLIPCTV
jgi:hypothetical protein